MRYIFRLLKWLILLIWGAICTLPLMLLVISSLKSESDYSINGMFALPAEWKFSNYQRAILHESFFVYLKNSVIVLILTEFLLIIIAMLASYVFARLWFKARQPLYSFVVACMAVPIHSVLVPVFLLTRDIGMYDSIYGLIGPNLAFNLPVSVFILTSFMQQIPSELEEAAEIDGCNKHQIFIRIIAPLSIAGIVTIAIYTGTGIWNEFSFALVLTESSMNHTLPFSLWVYMGNFSNNVPMLFAVLTLSVVPMILAFAIGRDKLVKGMIAGALKG